MPTYCIQPARPRRLRCEACGKAVGRATDAAPRRGLSAVEAARLFPWLTDSIQVHELVCRGARPGPTE